MQPAKIIGFLVAASVAIVAAGVVIYWAMGAQYRAWWQLARKPHGKKALLVYSHSPKWQDRIEKVWLPRLRDQVVVVNGSAPGSGTSRDRGVHKYFAGDKEHTPCVIVFESLWRVKVFRFFKAFQKAKHGKDQQLRSLEAEMFAAVDGGCSTERLKS